MRDMKESVKGGGDGNSVRLFGHFESKLWMLREFVEIFRS